MIRRLVLLTAGILALGAAGCNHPPVPGRVFVGGDSLTMQTVLTDGALPASYDVDSMLGWQAEDVQPGLSDRVQHAGTSPQIVVIALGENDGLNGLDNTDRLQLAQLADTAPDACVAWVLPWYLGTDQVKLAGIADYRAFVTDWAAANGQHTVDWKPVALAHPEYVNPDDGTHLTDAGRPVYGQLIQQGAASCG